MSPTGTISWVATTSRPPWVTPTRFPGRRRPSVWRSASASDRPSSRLQKDRDRLISALVKGANPHRQRIGERHSREAPDEFAEHQLEFELRQARPQTKMGPSAERSAGLSRAADVKLLRVIEYSGIMIRRSQETDIRGPDFGRPAAEFRALRGDHLGQGDGAVEPEHFVDGIAHAIGRGEQRRKLSRVREQRDQAVADHMRGRFITPDV